MRLRRAGRVASVREDRQEASSSSLRGHGPLRPLGAEFGSNQGVHRGRAKVPPQWVTLCATSTSPLAHGLSWFRCWGERAPDARSSCGGVTFSTSSASSLRRWPGIFNLAAA
jgi:hypothetical protein